MSAPVVRWTLSPRDFHAHAVTDMTDGPTSVMIARCGAELPTAAGLDAAPRASVCRGFLLAVGPADIGGWGGPP